MVSVKHFAERFAATLTRVSANYAQELSLAVRKEAIHREIQYSVIVISR